MRAVDLACHGAADPKLFLREFELPILHSWSMLQWTLLLLVASSAKSGVSTPSFCYGLCFLLLMLIAWAHSTDDIEGLTGLRVYMLSRLEMIVVSGSLHKLVWSLEFIPCETIEEASDAPQSSHCPIERRPAK